jgi:ABC-type dipeptide/oligopeptide/nickel transport system permease component
VKLLRAISIRLLFGAVSLLFISLVTFGANELAPGDAALIFAGEKASVVQIARIRHNMGLDRPWPIRYVSYLEDALHGDFGRSYYGVQEPVSNIIKRTLPMTAKLATLAAILSAGIGIACGTLSAVFQKRFADRTVLTLSTLLITLPNFVLAPVLVYIYCLKLNYLPQTWTEPLQAPEWMYLVLPVAILAARPTALITRLTRTSMIDTLQMEFIRSAVAKGVPRGRLIFKHALRNAILPVITAIGTSFGFLLTGSFVVERFFILPGIGSATIEAIQQSNMPVVQACILVTGAMFIFLNLIVDIVLPILDPRIRESQV